jgi:TnpA family transposase
MSAGEQRTNYKDLLYIRRRYITKDQLRAAIREVVNATLRERLPQIWGEGTTACASALKEVWRLGSKSHDRMARPLRRPGRHDLFGT